MPPPTCSAAYARAASETSGGPRWGKSHPDLAKAAREARRRYAAGVRIVNDVDDGTVEYYTLNEWEIQLHQEFHDGRLEKAKKDANRAFGHAIGFSTDLPIEQMAVYSSISSGMATMQLHL